MLRWARIVYIRIRISVLDIQRYLSLLGVSGVVIYQDDVQDDGFYLIAESPRFLSAEGWPLIDFTRYGAGTGDEFRSSGGFFTCTTSLGLLPEERQHAEAALAARLRDLYGSEAHSPVTLGVDWLSGSASLRLSPALHLSGRPSLTGENSCVFQHALTKAEADDLDGRWRDGEGGLEVVYEMKARARDWPGGAEMVFRGRLPLSAELHRRCVRRVSVE